MSLLPPPFSPQTKRKLTLSIDGYNGDIHSYEGGNEKRLTSPVEVPSGAGKVHKVHDPIVTYEPLTVKIVVSRNNPFLADLQFLHFLHRNNRALASRCLITSWAPDGRVERDLTYTGCTIQDIQIPPGDVLEHAPALATVIIDVEGMVTD